MSEDLKPIARAAADTVHEFGTAKLAAHLHKSVTTLHHEVDEGYETAKLGLLDAVRVMRHTEDYRVLYAVGEACGHRVMPELSSLVPHADEALLSRFAALAKESGDVFGSFQAAILDGRITPHEVDAFERELWEMMRTGMSVALLMREQSAREAHLPLQSRMEVVR